MTRTPADSTAWQRKLDPPVEPEGGIFIDRGLPVPDFYAGDRLRAMPRDPMTLFVYWEADHDAPGGWHLAAYDHGGSFLAGFSTPPGRHRSGYLEVGDVARVASVVLSRIVDGRPQALWTLAVAFAPSTPPSTSGAERWIDLSTGTAHGEPPAEGYLDWDEERAAAFSSLDALRVGQPGTAALLSSDSLLATLRRRGGGTGRTGR